MASTTRTTNRSTVVGVFESRERAQQAIQELKRAGFHEDQIGVATRHDEDDKGALRSVDDHGTHAAEGAATGLAAGAGVGALWGLGIVAGVLPAIGPAIAGGALAAILSSAAAGAAAAGLAGALIGLGIPEDEAEYYEGEFKQGRTIVTVKANGRYDEATAVMRRFGAYDMHNRQATATGASHTAARGQTMSSTHAAGGKTVQAREEELHVEKRPVEHDVHVRKEVHTEQKTINVPVEREEVVVERHPVSGHKAASGPISGDEDIRVPVREEEVHVEKTPVVKEEVTVGKRKVRDNEKVSETVRKEDIHVDREDKRDRC